jgi:hypothetical protein
MIIKNYINIICTSICSKLTVEYDIYINILQQCFGKISD